MYKVFLPPLSFNINSDILLITNVIMPTCTYVPSHAGCNGIASLSVENFIDHI